MGGPYYYDVENRFQDETDPYPPEQALAVPHEEALRIRDDVAFFQVVRSALAKRADAQARPQEELDHAVRQIVSRAVASGSSATWRSSCCKNS